jgi:Mrp family chromosome partitioning ATPase
MSDPPHGRGARLEDEGPSVLAPALLRLRGRIRAPRPPSPDVPRRALDAPDGPVTDAEFDERPAERPSSPTGDLRDARPLPGTGLARLPAPTPFIWHPAGGICPSRAVSLIHAPDSAAAAQWRVLKFKLKENGDPRVVAVTAAADTEDSSLAAINLALSLAEGQRARVVLVDANLRSPSLSSLLGLEPTTGLTGQLRRRREGSDLPWELYELASNFFLLPCEAPAEHAAAILSSDEFSTLFGDLRLCFDFVVVDTPAALSAADANTVQELVDGVILVCQSGRSTRGEVRRAIDRLSQDSLLGLVLTGAR